MELKTVFVVIKIEVEKDIPELGELVANRAHTIQGVRNAWLVKGNEPLKQPKTVPQEPWYVPVGPIVP